MCVYCFCFRLLYMLALQPAFLRDLWSAILNVTQISLFGSPTPLLNMISKGLAMTQSETLQIVPLLAAFCSLFSLLVVTLHDAEFYKDDDIVGKYLDFVENIYHLIFIIHQLPLNCKIMWNFLY